MKKAKPQKKPAFKDLVIRFSWRWDGKKWTDMRMKPGTSDYITEDGGTVCFNWQPMHGLHMTNLDLDGVELPPAVGANHFDLAFALKTAVSHRWADVMPGGYDMWKKMTNSVDDYMQRYYTTEDQ
jgi:hypothetical protein